MGDQKYRDAIRTPTGSVELIEQTVEQTTPSVITGMVSPSGLSISVVVVVNDHPEHMMRCLRSIRQTTERWSVGLLKVIVVDNGSDKFTKEMLERESGLWDKLLSVDMYHGWLPAVVAGFEQATDTDIVVLMDQAVEVFDGCFERVQTAFNTADGKLGMATVWSSKQVPAFRGMSLKATAEAFNASEPLECVGLHVGLPSPAFVAFNCRAFDEIGGWQENIFGPGYGAVEDVAMRMCKSDYWISLVPGVLVRDESDWPVAMPVGEDGSRVLEKRWGREKLWEAASCWPTPKPLVSAVAGMKQTHVPTVVWVFRETVICGAALLAAHVSNELIRLGWESTIACTRFDSGHQNVMPMDFGPMIYSNDMNMVKGLINDLPEGAIVIAPLWVTTKIVKEVCEQRPDLHPVYYVQDDEARFTTSAGEFYTDRTEVEASYSVLPNVVANSMWVADLIGRITGEEAPVICPGVDPLMFRPDTDKWLGGMVTVMAHCRPKTPRRGWAFVEAVMRRVAMRRDVRFVTYDEIVDDCYVPCHVQFGRLSPSRLAKQMRRADIFIEGSDVQGFGMQALEAMSCGLAVVCTDNLGIDTFGTSMHDCVVVPHGDVERAAAVICRLVDEKQERRQLGHNARQVGRDFSWETIGKLWDEYLKGVIGA